jgi:predicted DsbA family dithiol-disulfide isomerase
MEETERRQHNGAPQQWRSSMASRSRHRDVDIDLAADGAARSAVDELTHGDRTARLEAANRLRHAAEALVTELVAEAREEGATWADIGEVLGVSTQAAHQRYRWAARQYIDAREQADEDDDEDVDVDLCERD